MVLKMLIICMMALQQPSVYDYSFTTIDGKKVSFSEFKGKNILIVNTASKCGFTKQYKDLQELHKQYGQDVVIIGFPSANFGGQEFGDNEEIQSFCEENYGVTFLLSEKVEVKGDNITELFKYLTTAENPDFVGDINWNFEKFLINKEGKLIHRFRSKTNPLDKEIVSLLAKK